MAPVLELQKTTCSNYGASFDPPVPNSRMGVALQSLADKPTYGIRVNPENGTNGWYIWAGERSDAKDFFQPLCLEHIYDYCALAAPFLALPPGWAFINDGSYADVWFEPEHLKSSDQNN